LYKPSERVHDTDELGHQKLRVYPRDTFIYRQAGRDREKSASYYTPQELTRCVVKYALKELLKDKKADEILSLTLVSPQWVAAFLNEAVNQLAEAYLERKQAEPSAVFLTTTTRWSCRRRACSLRIAMFSASIRTRRNGTGRS